MDIKQIRKCCGFYREEKYIDGMDNSFCEMRHVRYSISYPDFKPTNGYCSGLENCPIYKCTININLHK